MLIKHLLKYFLFIPFVFTSFSQQALGKLVPKNKEKELVYYSADIISADLLTEEASLKGNVRILFDNFELSAKEATVSRSTSTLKAHGHVRIEGNRTLIEAEEVELNYADRSGIIRNARIMSRRLLLEAEEILKIDNEFYEAKKASVTTCSTCPPAWRIKAKKVKTNINKYLDVRGGKFQVVNQTILPLPRLVLPLNTRRKTGVLQPEFASLTSDIGYEITLPYFWAINPHKDLTIFPKLYFSNDFFEGNANLSSKIMLEYRHLLSTESKLKLKTALMYDANYQDFRGQRTPFFRNLIDFENFFVLPGGFIQKSKVSIVSDNDYLADFRSEVEGLNQASLLNSVSLSKKFSLSFLSIEALYNINLLTQDPRDNNELAIHKIPEVRYSFLDRPILGNWLFGKADVVYSNFARRQKQFDKTNGATDETRRIISGDGTFDAGSDLIRNGHRLRLESELSAPFKIGRIFDVLPSISYRDSYYRFLIPKDTVINQTSENQYNELAFSRYLEGRVSLRTEISKLYGNKYKHKIIPDLTFRYGSNIVQSDNIFFNALEELPYHRLNRPITDFDFFNFSHGVQFDYWDRFFKAEYAELSLTNILIWKRAQDNINFYEQPFYFNIYQGYDFKNAREATGSDRDPWSNLESTLKLRSKYFETVTRASYYHTADVIDFSTRNRFPLGTGKFLQLNYNSSPIVDDNNVAQERVENIGGGLGWDFDSVKFFGEINYSIVDRQDLGWKMSFTFTPPGSCWDLFLYVLKPNDVDDDSSPQYYFSASFNLGPDLRYKKSLLNF